MEGKGDNPILFEKKSSVCKVCSNRTDPVGLPNVEALRGLFMPRYFLAF